VAKQVQQEWEEQLLQLASSVLGSRHWTTNLLLLLHLDRSLKKMSSDMITSGSPPDLMEVAELIDYLERLVRFVDGLSLNLHKGHLLGNVVIGVARTLVTLGDVKSKKYAAEWLEKIQNDYVNSLYQLNAVCQYKAQDKIFQGEISGVNEKGELVMNVNGATKIFRTNEIIYLSN